MLARSHQIICKTPALKGEARKHKHLPMECVVETANPMMVAAVSQNQGANMAAIIPASMSYKPLVPINTKEKD